MVSDAKQRDKKGEKPDVMRGATTERLPRIAPKAKPEAVAKPRSCDGPQTTTDLVLKNLIVFGPITIIAAAVAAAIAFL